jgi:hypothetical protein
MRAPALFLPSSQNFSFFSHRGLYASVNEENTLRAFRNALSSLDGIELDVRLGKDGVPVAVHDASLWRTHGLKTRVASTSAESLRLLSVPKVEEVMQLVGKHGGKGVVLDMKIPLDGGLFRELMRLGTKYHIPASKIVFLVRHRVSFAYDGGPLFLRAVKLRFESKDDGTHGVACHFDGSDRNEICIRRALGKGLVNVWCPRKAHFPRLLTFLDGIESVAPLHDLLTVTV